MKGKPDPLSPRRSLLFVPGDSPRKLAKATQLGADMVIFDLEDSVDVSQKPAARQQVAVALAELDFGRSERLVRINSPDTPFFAEDLAMIAQAEVAGIVVPKAETGATFQSIAARLRDAAGDGQRSDDAICLFALVETAFGIMNIREIAQASDALLFGAEDLAASLGARRTRDGWETFYARSIIVTAAAAYGLPVIDTVFVDVRDLAGLEEDAVFARQLGYSGKMAIHPGQVEVINRVFSPTAEEIARAQYLLGAFHSHQAKGEGVFSLDGRMVDRPMIRSAERTLERARLCEHMDG